MVMDGKYSWNRIKVINDMVEDVSERHTYYFDIFKDILYYGFKFKNEKYIFITSSAGQIRTKKAVFIKESIWKKIKDTIMNNAIMELSKIRKELS